MIYSFQITNRYMYVKWTNFFQKKTVDIWNAVNAYKFLRKMFCVLVFGFKAL